MSEYKPRGFLWLVILITLVWAVSASIVNVLQADKLATHERRIAALEQSK
jgi:hypothetical protein